MKIIFSGTRAGTGAAEGIPLMRCSCECFAEARIKGGTHLRQNSGVLLKEMMVKIFLLTALLKLN